MNNKSKEIISLLKEDGFSNLFIDDKNVIFLDYLKTLNRKEFHLNKTNIAILWENCHNEKLTEEQIVEKIQLLSQKNYFKIDFLKTLPPVNLSKLTILIKKEDENKFKDHWIEFETFMINSNIAHSEQKRLDFFIEDTYSYKNLLSEIFKIDSTIKKAGRKKQLFILFFLFLVSKRVALLPALYIFSVNTFFSYTMSLKRIEFFQKKHFFITMPNQKHLILKELNTNYKSKYIFYLRFSFLINYEYKLLENFSEENLNQIFEHLKSSDKSSTMTNINFLPIKKILYYHGAKNLSISRFKDTHSYTALEIITSYINKTNNKSIINAFIRYFNNKNDTSTTRRNAKNAIQILTYLDEMYGEMAKEEIKEFFLLNYDSNKKEYNSKFTLIMDVMKFAPSTKEDLQKVIFESIEGDSTLTNCFHKENLIPLYKYKSNKRIARLAFDKNILEKMKYICLIDPPKDSYYVSTKGYLQSIDSWKHFDKSEPQLPVMLFMHLCMPWRSEHILSLDRNSFLVKNEHGKIVEFKITTDKNQKNDFFIEREFFEYSFNFKYNNTEIDVIQLLSDTLEHAKNSFKNIKPIYRKNNPTWGKIVPILCRNNGQNFITKEIYTGYYFKILLKALYSLKYTIDEIQYFVQLSTEGKKRLNNFPKSFNQIEDLSCGNINRFFISSYFSPHALRKSNITHLLNDGKRLEFILKLSGHSALSTVLKVYIDFDLLIKLNISDDVILEIKDNFQVNSTLSVGKEILENFKKYHFINNMEILQHIEKHNLISSVITYNKEQKVESLKNTNKKLLEPIFWEKLSTGICTIAFNCPVHIQNKCSLCPFFYTSSKFFSAINSKIMQITTRIVKYFKIINKHMFEENLNNREAILYEEEVKKDLVELQGYLAIIDKMNDQILNTLMNNLSEEEQNKLPKIADFSFLKTNHINFLGAQLEIYKLSQQNFESNPDIEYSISELYKKIIELILSNDLPKELFIDAIDDYETTINRFINLIGSNKSILEKIKNTFLLK